MGQLDSEYGVLSQVLLGDGLYVEHLVSVDHLAQLGAAACRSAGLPRASFATAPAQQAAPWDEVVIPATKPSSAVRRQRRTWRRLKLPTPARVARSRGLVQAPPVRDIPCAKRVTARSAHT